MTELVSVTDILKKTNLVHPDLTDSEFLKKITKMEEGEVLLWQDKAYVKFCNPDATGAGYYAVEEFIKNLDHRATELSSAFKIIESNLKIQMSVNKQMREASLWQHLKIWFKHKFKK